MKTKLFFVLLMAYCCESSAQYVWTQKADFPIVRDNATAFNVSTKIGVSSFAGLGSNPATYNDWWEYNAVTNTWTQKADFPGTPRRGALGFVIGGFGYVCVCETGSAAHLADLWQYDPILDTWVQKSDFPA